MAARVRQFLLWSVRFSVLYACCASGAGQARHSDKQKTQNAPTRQPRALQVTSKKILTIPAFGFYGEPLSDDSGNLYFEPANQRDSTIFKLSQLNESNSKMIQAPPDRSGADDSSLVSIIDDA